VRLLIISVLAVATIGLMVPSVSAEEKVPSWVKSTAGWWATDQIEESEFLKAIEFLIKHEIIQISETSSTIYSKNLLEIKEIESIASDGYIFTSGESKTKWYIPERGEYMLELEISGEVYWDQKTINPLRVEVISPNGDESGIFGAEIGTGEFYGTYPITTKSEPGKYKINVKFGEREFVIGYFLLLEKDSSVPDWIKNNAKWWADGNISDKNFLDGIKFLIENGVIQTSDDLEVLVESIDDISKTLPINEFSNIWDAHLVNGDYENRTVLEFWKDGLLGVSSVYTKDSLNYQTEKRFLTNGFDYEKEIILDYPKIQCYHIIERILPTELNGVVLNSISNYTCFMLDIQTSSAMSLSDRKNFSFDYVEFQKQIVYSTLENILEKIGVDTNLANLDKLEKSSQSIVPESNPNITSTTEGFSGLSCRQDGDTVTMSGKYTNGPIPHGSIWFTMGLEDSVGTILTTGSGLISDIGAYQTKMFSVYTQWEYGFENCIIEVAYTTDP
jgi:hypothetical protein